MSCHGKTAYSLCASALPLHLTSIAEGCLSFSECSEPLLLSQLPSLWPFLGACIQTTLTPLVWEGSVTELLSVIQGHMVV